MSYTRLILFEYNEFPNIFTRRLMRVLKYGYQWYIISLSMLFKLKFLSLTENSSDFEHRLNTWSDSFNS